MDDLVLYIYGVYLGLAKKVKDPFVPSSIFASLETSKSGLLTISSSKINAIYVALNFKLFCLVLMKQYYIILLLIIVSFEQKFKQMS